jgi:hypothetical protein
MMVLLVKLFFILLVNFNYLLDLVLYKFTSKKIGTREDYIPLLIKELIIKAIILKI